MTDQPTEPNVLAIRDAAGPASRGDADRRRGVPPLLPRCRFTQIGMECCPGCRAHGVAEQPSRWLVLPVPPHVTCEHMRAQATDRGMVAACAHPLGQAVGWWEAARARVERSGS